jgi:TolA-binding protein
MSCCTQQNREVVELQQQLQNLNQDLEQTTIELQMAPNPQMRQLIARLKRDLETKEKKQLALMKAVGQVSLVHNFTLTVDSLGLSPSLSHFVFHSAQVCAYRKGDLGRTHKARTGTGAVRGL